MSPQQLQQFNDMQRRITDLERQILNPVVRPDRYVFNKPITGGANGVRVGMSGDKIGMYGVAPVAQAAAVTTPSGGGGGAGDAVDVSARVAIVQIKAILKNIGASA